MSRTRSAEIVGGGFAGLAAACALAQRGWRVRLHERAERLRTAGAGINVYENGLRVLEALGALEETLADNARHLVRETRDQHDRLLSTHPWHIRVYGVLRQRMVDALAAAGPRARCRWIRRCGKRASRRSRRSSRASATLRATTASNTSASSAGPPATSRSSAMPRTPFRRTSARAPGAP